MRKFSIITFLIMGFAATGFAQGVVAVTYDSPVENLDMVRVTFTCVADAGGNLPVTPITAKILELVDGMWLCSAVSFPSGTSAPTALWDVEIQETRHGATWDVMGGAMADRSATDAEVAVPRIDTFGGCVQNLNTLWEIAITNVGADAEVIIDLHFVRR
jgi:hypothetical protein